MIFCLIFIVFGIVTLQPLPFPAFTLYYFGFIASNGILMLGFYHWHPKYSTKSSQASILRRFPKRAAYYGFPLVFIVVYQGLLLQLLILPQGVLFQ
ncbi:MAG: hypothetical protein ACLFR1_10080 [Spirochaetia bacterium]